MRKIAFLIGVGLLVLAGGCGPQKVAAPPEKVFYPPAPDMPRLQFLTSFNSGADWTGPKKSSFSSFIAGETVMDEPSSIKSPYSITVRDGKLYICDLGPHVVHVIDTVHKTYSQLGARGQLDNPVHVAIDTDGTKYVCDTGKRKIAVFDASDQFRQYIGEGDKSAPCDVVISGQELYVLDGVGAKVEAWSKSGKFLRSIAVKGVEPGQLNLPSSLAIGPNGHLYVCDNGASIVNEYDSQGRFIKSIGTPGDRPGCFARPKGIAIDRENQIYVSDALWEIVQAFNAQGRVLVFFGGASPKPYGMGMPAGLAIDSSSLSSFGQFVDDNFKAEYLLFVTNQFGINKINVYAYGKVKDPSKLPPPPQATTRPASRPASGPASRPTTTSAPAK